MAILIPECLTNVIRLKEEQLISSSFPINATNTYIDGINEASRYIKRLCKRIYLKYKTITEYHDGKGCEFLNTKHWPIISITSLYDDADRTYGSNSLFDSDEFEIYNADAGVVRVFDQVFGDNQSNVKIVYIAGYSTFEIYPGCNRLQFKETNIAVTLTATLTVGSYNAASLAIELKKQLDAEGALTYTVSYSEVSHKFTISSTANFQLLWSTGIADTAELGKLLGFDIEADDTSASSYTSDEPVLGLPEDLIAGCEELVRWRYSNIKENRVGKFAETRGEQTFSFDYSNIPRIIKDLIMPFRAIRIY